MEMCEPASMILTRTEALIGRGTNSHTRILAQYGIRDTVLTPNFVKIEMRPPKRDGIPDYNAPFNQWTYYVDQDYLPSWYVHEINIQRVRDAL